MIVIPKNYSIREVLAVRDKRLSEILDPVLSFRGHAYSLSSFIVLAAKELIYFLKRIEMEKYLLFPQRKPTFT